MSKSLDYVVAIPSYKRKKLIKTHTLQLLQDYQISPKKIFIFVANKTEFKEYTSKLPEKYHSNIIIGKKGLHHQRNFISSFFPKNKYIVQMDDDIRKLVELSAYDSKNRKANKIVKVKDFNTFIVKAYQQLIHNKAFIWGVYPICNPYFMFPRMTTDLRFVVGPFFGIINRKIGKLKNTIEEKEDVERTLQYYSLDNTVLRFNNVAIDTTYYKTKGGLQHSKKDRIKDASVSADYLHKKYPTLTRIKNTKKSGITEIELIRPKVL
jgi:hypothetical protein